MAKNLDNQIALLQSKSSDEWGTPPDLYTSLDQEFHFDLDVCASEENHKNKNFYTKEDNALEKPWPGVIFCNPPYSLTGKFLEKAHKELKNGNCDTVVFLIFSNTDTKYFHNLILGKAEIRFIKGRLKFYGKNKKGEYVNNSAMRPSMICILKKELYQN
jgi:site-specific DNA-methyltransferase (adenine-specific)